MRIVVLMENTACREDLAAEHGLSLYLETGDHKVLFDMGQSEAFADNAERLGVDLAQVDLAVLSHGHYDHGGGLRRFLQINGTAPVYVSPHAFGHHHNGMGRYIGLDQTMEGHPRLVPAEDGTVPGEGLCLRTYADRRPVYPVDPHGLQILRQDRLEPDPFLHEQYLLIREGEKTICVSGCAHRGVLNIMQWARPDVLVGGFHFKQILPQGEGAAMLDHAAQVLQGHPATYYTGHCTGTAQYAYLKERMGDRLRALSTGMEIWV